MTAYNGFKWPESGYVAAPDWDPSPECGRGLHGWARGEGHYVHEYNDGKWLVVDVLDADVVHLDGKCKFRAGTVVFCGTRQGAVAYLIQTGALTANSDPAWVCLTPGQAVQVAFACADRAVRVHVASALKSAGLADESAKLQSLAPIDSPSAADAARSAARAAARSADAAAYLADSADSAADSAAYSADSARLGGALGALGGLGGALGCGLGGALGGVLGARGGLGGALGGVLGARGDLGGELGDLGG